MEKSIYKTKKWADKFIHDSTFDAIEREKIGIIESSVPPDVRTALDVGCGRGHVYRRLKGLNGVKAFAVDLSPEALKKLQDGCVSFADVKDLPFRDGEFDLVLAADVIEHLENGYFSRGVAELARVSRKYIMIISPNRDAFYWPVALCAECGKEFNIYGHHRTIDSGTIKKIFPPDSFEILKIGTFGPGRKIRPRCLARMARTRGRVYSKEAVICPRCSGTSFSPPDRNIVEKFIGGFACGLFRFMDAVIPEFFRPKCEIYVLLRKKVKLHGLTAAASVFSGFRSNRGAESRPESNSSTLSQTWLSGGGVKT